MSYTVQFSNPNKTPLVVANSALNNSTSLALIGPNKSGYGQSIADNFLHLLENYANSSPPANPIEGQLWYDTTYSGNKILKVYE